MSDDYLQDTGEIMPPQTTRPLPVPEPLQRTNLIFASPDCAEVFGALCDFQGACEPPKKTKTATVKGTTRQGGTYDYKYAYAPLDEIHNVIRSPMKEAGLAYRQFLASRDGNWMMRTIVAHRSGQWIGCDYPIFSGRQEGAQGFASGVTYARRYGLMLALGIVAEDDDDANVADAQPATITGHDRKRTHDVGSASTYTRAAETLKPNRVDKEIAQEKWKTVARQIDSALTVPDLISITGDHNLPPSADWRDMTDAVNKVEPAEVANRVFAGLREKIEKRRAMILGENLDHGEMA